MDVEGVCSACRNFERRLDIDWDARRELFLEIFSGRNKSSWDCVVPVSGGKDSTYQIIKIVELGLNPLAVTATTCHLTDIGRRNLDNIGQLGVDHIHVTPNPKVRAKLNRYGLEEVGDISWPEHVGIFTIPVKVAIKFGVSTVVWGENSQNEYGGPDEAARATELDRRWLEEFGGLLGLRLNDLQEQGFSSKDLDIYRYPSVDELEAAGVRGVFLGQFFEWNGLSNAIVAQSRGFETFGKRVEGSFVDYENLDNYQTGIHDYFKYLKFGFGRATDIASTLIRRGIISRPEGMSVVEEVDGQYPTSYLDVDLEEILRPLNLDKQSFDSICDSFTNRSLFQSTSDGTLVRREDGSPALKVG